MNFILLKFSTFSDTMASSLPVVAENGSVMEQMLKLFEPPGGYTPDRYITSARRELHPLQVVNFSPQGVIPLTGI